MRQIARIPRLSCASNVVPLWVGARSRQKREDIEHADRVSHLAGWRVHVRPMFLGPPMRNWPHWTVQS
jgi:hypothetical protein